MQSKQDHRQHIQEAFRQIQKISARITIAKLIPTEEEFVMRYCKRQAQAQTQKWQNIFADGASTRRS